MRKKGTHETPSKSERCKYATVKRGSKCMYPIRPGNKKDARDALRLIGRARPPLNAKEKAAVKRRANLVLKTKAK